MNDLLTTILQNITTKPDAVQISMEMEGDVEVYTIRVDQEDVGRVIGKSGKVIRAIRSLAHVSAVQQQKRVRVHLDDGGEPKPEPEAPQAAQEDIDQAATEVTPVEVPEVEGTTTEAAPESVVEEAPVEAPAETKASAKPEPAVEDLLPEEPAK